MGRAKEEAAFITEHGRDGQSNGHLPGLSFIGPLRFITGGETAGPN